MPRFMTRPRDENSVPDDEFVAHFRLIRELGRGGFATTYEAVHVRDGDAVDEKLHERDGGRFMNDGDSDRNLDFEAVEGDALVLVIEMARAEE